MRPNRFELAVRIIPAAVLVLVAVVQIGVSRVADLTPWKGGGFGMFSSLDHGAFRGVDIVLDGPDRSEALEIPPSLEELAARAANLPADWLLGRLASGVVARERRYHRDVDTVTITVWRTHFDLVTLRAEERTLRRFEYSSRTRTGRFLDREPPKPSGG
jgi:hypothetical protein